MCKEWFRHEGDDRRWNPATAIALAVPAEADVDMDIADQLHRQLRVARRHRGAWHDGMRATL